MVVLPNIHMNLDNINVMFVSVAQAKTLWDTCVIRHITKPENAAITFAFMIDSLETEFSGNGVK